MPCVERLRLLESCQSRADLFAWAVQRRRELCATASPEAYRDLLRFSDDARLECRTARAELEKTRACTAADTLSKALRRA